jgi:hypothetical protein
LKNKMPLVIFLEVCVFFSWYLEKPCMWKLKCILTHNLYKMFCLGRLYNESEVHSTKFPFSSGASSVHFHLLYPSPLPLSIMDPSHFFASATDWLL